MNNPKSGDQGRVPIVEAQPLPSALLQADFVYQEDVDSGNPLNLDYFIPINCQTVRTARLSFRLRLYRTYSTFTATVTGAGSAHLHTTGAETGHTHNHRHGLAIAAGPSGTNMLSLNGGPLNNSGGPWPASSTVNTDNTRSTLH